MRGTGAARCLTLGAALLVLFSPSLASARKPAVRDPIAPLVARAKAALVRGEHAAAAQALTEAYTKRSDPAVLLLLGQVAVAEGRMVAAQDLCRRALAEAPDAGDDAARAAAQRAFAVEEPTSELSILGERGQLVFLDDHLVGRLPLPLPLLVSPGRHRLRLAEEGRERAVTAEAPPHRRTEVRIERDTGAVLVSRLPLVVIKPSGESVAEDVLGRLGLAAAARLRAEHLSVFVARRSGAAEPLPGPGDIALQLQVKQPTPGDFSVELTAIDSELREAAAHEQIRCAPCSEEAVAERVRERAVGVARAGLERPRGVLRVRSEPPGATVAIDGTERGAAPLELRRFTGTYRIRLQLPGYREALRQVTVVEGQPAELVVSLDPIPAPPKAPSGPLYVTRTERLRRPTWRLALGGVLLGGGALALGFGGGALSVHGQCIRPAEPPVEPCDQLYDTSTLGYSLLGGGAGLALIGTVLLAIPGPTRSYTIAVERPAQSGAAPPAGAQGVR
jgi:hypothetical protein